VHASAGVCPQEVGGHKAGQRHLEPSLALWCCFIPFATASSPTHARRQAHQTTCPPFPCLRPHPASEAPCSNKGGCGKLNVVGRSSSRSDVHLNIVAVLKAGVITDKRAPRNHLQRGPRTRCAVVCFPAFLPLRLTLCLSSSTLAWLG